MEKLSRKFSVIGCSVGFLCKFLFFSPIYKYLKFRVEKSLRGRASEGIAKRMAHLFP